MLRFRIVMTALVAGAMISAQAQPAPSPIMPNTPPPTSANGLPVVMRTPGGVMINGTLPTPVASKAEVKGPPALKFETTSVDAGSHEAGETVEIAFPVTNTSDKKIAVTNIETGCGCTTASKTKFDLEPGTSTEVKVNFNTNGRLNEQSRAITVHTDDPNSPTYTLKFKLNVTHSLWAEPAFIDFRDIGEGEKATRDVSIFNAKAEPLEIKEVKISDPSKLSAVLKEKKSFTRGDQSGTEFVYTLTTDDKLAAGDYSLSVDFVTSGESKLAPVNARINVRGPVQLSQQRIYGSLQLNEETSRTLQLTSRNGKPFTIKSMTVDENLPMKLTSEDVKDDATKKKVVANITGTDKAATVQGKAHITVQMEGGEKEYKIDIPVYLAFGNRRRTAPPSGVPAQQHQNAASQKKSVTIQPVETKYH